MKVGRNRAKSKLDLSSRTIHSGRNTFTAYGTKHRGMSRNKALNVFSKLIINKLLNFILKEMLTALPIISSIIFIHHVTQRPYIIVAEKPLYSGSLSVAYPAAALRWRSVASVKTSLAKNAGSLLGFVAG